MKMMTYKIFAYKSFYLYDMFSQYSDKKYVYN